MDEVELKDIEVAKLELPEVKEVGELGEHNKRPPAKWSFLVQPIMETLGKIDGWKFKITFRW